MVETSIKMKQKEVPVTPLDDSKWTVTDVILETLNDYLVNIWADSKIKKKVKSGPDLMNDAIESAIIRLPQLHPLVISRTTKYLAKENKLIGLDPDDIF